MRLGRLAVIAAMTMVISAGTAATAQEGSDGPVISPLAMFGSGLGSGSAIGPDGALYVTDGNAGRLLRIDRRSGRTTMVASGLPPQVLGIGGAMDVAFLGGTPYVLVTMVGGAIATPDGLIPYGDGIDGIYRLERGGTFTVVADIGAWSAAHPPATDWFLTTGVQYALDVVDGAFVVTDGHHNRVLRVDRAGTITVLASFADVVPTGIEVSRGRVYIAQAGPVPHRPSDARVVEVSVRTGAVTTVGSGRGATGPGLTVDVERGRDGTLYALLQGVWDLAPTPDNEGSPASPGTGQLVAIAPDGTFRTIADHLDRPTSLELVGDTAYVVTLGGTVVRIDDVD